MFYIYFNASQYVMFVYLIFMSQIGLCFLHSTLILQFYTDVVFTRSILIEARQNPVHLT